MAVLIIPQSWVTGCKNWKKSPNHIQAATLRGANWAGAWRGQQDEHNERLNLHLLWTEKCWQTKVKKWCEWQLKDLKDLGLEPFLIQPPESFTSTVWFLHCPGIVALYLILRQSIASTDKSQLCRVAHAILLVEWLAHPIRVALLPRCSLRNSHKYLKMKDGTWEELITPCCKTWGTHVWPNHIGCL